MTTHIKRDEARDGEVCEGAVAFTLTAPVDPALLDAELSTKMNWRKDGGIVVEGLATEASPESPVTVWVTRDDVDAKALQSVVAAHEVPEPGTDPTSVLRAKIHSEKSLSAADIKQALRLLLP